MTTGPRTGVAAPTVTATVNRGDTTRDSHGPPTRNVSNMARTDAAGNEHPTWDDIPGKDGYLHIADCPQCSRDFDGPILWHARDVKAANGL